MLHGAVVSVDDTVREGVTLESLAKLKPAFEWEDRRTTAGNASGVGDGAAICIITTRQYAQTLGLPIIAKYVTSAFVGGYSKLGVLVKSLNTIFHRCGTTIYGYISRCCYPSSSCTNWSH